MTVGADDEWVLSDRSVAVMLCPFRLCPWVSDDTRTMTPAGADKVARQHMLDAHREQLDGFAALLAESPEVTPLPPPLWTATDGDHRAHLLAGDTDDRVRLVIEDRTGRRMSVSLPVEALRRGYEATGRHLTTALGRNVDDELLR